MDATFFRKGDRVRLVRMADPYGPVPAGSLGTVTGTSPPPANVVDVDWDCGRGLNACLDEDAIELVSWEGAEAASEAALRPEDPAAPGKPAATCAAGAAPEGEDASCARRE